MDVETTAETSANPLEQTHQLDAPQVTLFTLYILCHYITFNFIVSVLLIFM